MPELFMEKYALQTYAMMGRTFLKNQKIRKEIQKMNWWKIVLILGGITIFGGAVVLGITRSNERKQLDDMLLEMEEEKLRRKRREELRANGYNVDDHRTPMELQKEINDRFEELGLGKPEVYNLCFTENGLLVKIDFEN